MAGEAAFFRASLISSDCRVLMMKKDYSAVKKTFFLIIPVFLAILTSAFIFFYIFSTSKLVIDPHQTHLHVNLPTLRELSKVIDVPAAAVVSSSPVVRTVVSSSAVRLSALQQQSPNDTFSYGRSNINISSHFQNDSKDGKRQRPKGILGLGSNRNISETIDEAYHEGSLFLEEYKQMNTSLKIYVYPHKRKDPFANVLLPVDYEIGGNYASESYFKKALFGSHFITKDPSEADLFYLPFSIASLRNDKRVGVGGIQGFIKDYIFNISHNYPYWNRSGGADHFYVACHSIGRNAMEKAVEVKLNAIQIVCSSSYFLSGYITHKDASIPQIWPRKGPPPDRAPSQRKQLAFFAGAMNSPVRQFLVQTWANDSDIFVNRGRLKTPYSEALLGSKYCIHAKGFEINTARIGDALFYGCVPIILADHYDLPFADILNWRSFSVVISTWDDMKNLKRILQNIGFDDYLRMQKNVLKVQKHFIWHNLPVDFDAFYMVMYELWLRRSHLRISHS